MDPKSAARITRIARCQRTLFTQAQALSAGFDHSTIRRWVDVGIWEEPAPRVFRYSTSEPTWEEELLAAVLSSNAVAARRSAAALFKLLSPPRTPELLVVRGRRNLDRAIVHSTIELPSSDLTQVGPIPTTAPSRTIVDVAAALRQPEVEQVVDRALLKRLCTPTRLERRARELVAPARPGAARVLQALATVHPDLEEARNDWEARVLRASDHFGLPRPVPNLKVHVGGSRRYLDAAWETARVSLEFDGYVPHLESRRVFDDDRVRQNDLIDAGWLVFRLTSSMLEGKASRHFAQVARAVSHRIGTHANVV